MLKLACHKHPEEELISIAREDGSHLVYPCLSCVEELLRKGIQTGFEIEQTLRSSASLEKDGWSGGSVCLTTKQR